MAAEKAEMDALKKECDALRTQIEVSGLFIHQYMGTFKYYVFFVVSFN